MATWDVVAASCCLKTSLSIFACFKTVYTVLKSLQKLSIIGQCPTLHNRRTDGFKIDWYPPKRGTCCMFSGEMPLWLGRLAACVEAPKLHPLLHLQRGLWVSFFRCHFLYLYHKKFEHSSGNNYAISLTIEARLPRHHSIKNSHFDTKFLPSFIWIFSLNVDESVSAHFGCF